MKKKSAKLAAKHFVETADRLTRYTEDIDGTSLSAQGKTWAYEAALIKLAVAFERLMLDALICATNNDTHQMSETLGIDFPKHLTDEVCEYIVTGGGFFDFKGRSGLLGTIKEFVGDGHYLYKAVQGHRYRVALEELIVLRNFAAHESGRSKHAALTVLNRKRLSSAGSYLKVHNRFEALAAKLGDLAKEIEASAPY